MDPDRARIEAIAGELRERGFLLRMTEWTEGFQCGAVLRGDTRIAFFSRWRRTELEAWEETRSLAEEWQRSRAPAASPAPA